MSEYNWCHNPGCHTIETQSRIRGTGDDKVLRTRRIPLTSHYVRNSIWAYFCNQRCLMEFLNKFKDEIAQTYSVKAPIETPIKVKTGTYDTHRYRYTHNGYERYETKATRKIIENSS